jgi:hypothetical protein
MGSFVQGTAKWLAMIANQNEMVSDYIMERVSLSFQETSCLLLIDRTAATKTN